MAFFEPSPPSAAATSSFAFYLSFLMSSPAAPAAAAVDDDEWETIESSPEKEFSVVKKHKPVVVKLYKAGPSNWWVGHKVVTRFLGTKQMHELLGGATNVSVLATANDTHVLLADGDAEAKKLEPNPTAHALMRDHSACKILRGPVVYCAKKILS